MQYQIKDGVYSTTKNGANKFNCKARDTAGNVFENVTFWQKSWPDVFANLVNMSTIVATLKTEQNGQYTNHTMYPETTSQMANTGATGAYPQSRGGGVNKAMETKKENIKEAQEYRTENVRISATARDATIILTTLFDDIANLPEIERDGAWEAKWKEIRKKLWKMWDYRETSEGYNGEPPINLEDIPF